MADIKILFTGNVHIFVICFADKTQAPKVVNNL